MCVDTGKKRVSLSALDFALGELRCGRLPWVSGWIWLVVICLLIGFVLGYEANNYALEAAKANAWK